MREGMNNYKFPHHSFENEVMWKFKITVLCVKAEY